MCSGQKNPKDQTKIKRGHRDLLDRKSRYDCSYYSWFNDKLLKKWQNNCFLHNIAYSYAKPFAVIIQVESHPSHFIVWAFHGNETNKKLRIDELGFCACLNSEIFLTKLLGTNFMIIGLIDAIGSDESQPLWSFQRYL